MKNAVVKRSFLLIVLSTLVLVFNFSCSHVQYPAHTSVHRSIAGRELSKYELADLVEKALEVNRTAKKSSTDLSSQFFSKDFSLKLTKIEFVENNTLSNDIAFKIYPYLVNNEYFIQIQHSPEALYDQGAFLELKQFFSIFNETQSSPSVAKKILSPIFGKETYRETAFFELLYNAKKGYLPAVKELLSRKIGGHSSNVAFFKEKVAFLNQLETKNSAFDNQTFYKKIFELKKDLSFRDKLAQNDRSAVVKLIEEKIPWDEMSPFEIYFWKSQLDIIKNPLPLERRVIIYRGVKTVNLFNKDQENKKKILDNQRFYQMANFFSSNGDINNAYLEKSLATSVIANNLKIHSIQSAKSLFISLTPSVNVARAFADDAMAAFAVDPRILFFNEASAFIDENEYLMSFITFPEDVLGIVEVSEKEKKINPLESFKLENKISEKIASNLKKSKGDLAYSQLKQNTSNHFRSFSISTQTEKNMIRTIFQEELKVGPEVIIKKDSSTILQSCFILIKSFF